MHQPVNGFILHQFLFLQMHKLNTGEKKATNNKKKKGQQEEIGRI